ncbi:hypothetical protein MKX01_010864 [Papaver californicum]|nr:hypothetical protein MKX01_010864 [Papaver californicum]
MTKKKEDTTRDCDGDHDNYKVTQKVALYKLFAFADKYDIALMVVGTICSIANGLAQPLMRLIFGQLINSFGASDCFHVVHAVSKVLIIFSNSKIWFYSLARYYAPK